MGSPMDDPSILFNYLLALQVAGTCIALVGFQLAVARLNLNRETKRRWQHGLTGRALVLVSYVLPLRVAIPALCAGAAGIAYLRWCQPRAFVQHFGPLLRPYEARGRWALPGAFYFLIGTALTAALFPLSTARYAVDCLSVADPVAAWVGQSYPSRKVHASASVAGCASCFVTAWAIGALYFLPVLNVHSLQSPALWMVGGRISAGALACTIAEALPLGNDNLQIPLATAAAVHHFPQFLSSWDNR